LRSRRAVRARTRVRERHAIHGPVVVDASIAAQWFANEPGSIVAARLLEEDRRLFAPDFMPIEAASAWWRKVCLGDMRAADLDQAIVGLLGLDIEFASAASLLARAARLAGEVRQSVYDCLYLALARERDCHLATDDGVLRRTARRLDIAVWEP
jgi:predicted nucleic acid-binding protein